MNLRNKDRARPRRPASIAVLTLVTLACAVTVANGQVSVPGVQTPPVNTPPLQQNLPSVPKTPSVPVPSVPKTPSLPKAPSVRVPSVQVPGTGNTPKVPSVRLPSTGVTGGGGGRNAAGAPGAGTTGAGVAGSSASARTARARAAARRSHRRPASPKQRAAGHERRLRKAAHELEGCLPALSSFERDVIVLRGGLHGRSPLSRAKTATRLDVGAGRVRAAERSGLAGLRSADAEQGCGLRSGAGRNAAAQRLADGSVPSLTPLAATGSSPALVSTDKLSRDRGEVLGAHAGSDHGAGAKDQPRRASLIPTSGDDGSSLPAAVWAALLAALMLAGLGVLLVRRRQTADPYANYQAPSAYPYGWSAGDWTAPPPAESADPTPEPIAAEPIAAEPHDAPSAAAPPRTRRRDRAMQAVGGLAAGGAAVSLLLGRLAGRRKRR